jgi:transposase
MNDHEPFAGFANRRVMLEVLYTKEGLSMESISLRVGVSHSLIQLWMKRYDIPTRTRGGTNTKAAIQWRIHRIDPRVLFTTGNPELATIFSCSESLIYKYKRGVTKAWNFV